MKCGGGRGGDGRCWEGADNVGGGEGGLVVSRVSVGCFTPYRQLGSYSYRKPVWTFSVSVKNKFGLFQSLGDRIYEVKCLFVAVGPNARFIVLPHWDNMSKAHMLTHPVTF